jgi:hypothetical protein
VFEIKMCLSLAVQTAFQTVLTLLALSEKIMVLLCGGLSIEILS